MGEGVGIVLGRGRCDINFTEVQSIFFSCISYTNSKDFDQPILVQFDWRLFILSADSTVYHVFSFNIFYLYKYRYNTYQQEHIYNGIQKNTMFL